MKGRGSWSAAAACLAVTVALISGCGSSGSSTDSAETTTAAASETASSDASSGPLTKKEYVEQAEMICRQGLRKKDQNLNAAIKNLPPEDAGTLTKESGGKVVTLAILPVYDEIIEQLSGLTPPQSDEPAADLIVQKYEAAMQAAAEDPAATIDSNPFLAGDRAAEAYGITSCIL